MLHDIIIHYFKNIAEHKIIAIIKICYQINNTQLSDEFKTY